MEPRVEFNAGATYSTAAIYSTGELQKSQRWCCDVRGRAAKNFYYSFLALSGEKFQGMCTLYAFLRVTDDLGDEPGLPTSERETRLGHWQSDLHKLTSEPIQSHPVWPALYETHRRFAIPLEHLSAVIDGVRMDLHPVEMQSFEELERYCYLVAGAVGFCCLRIWGTNDPEADRLAVDCGLAFQLTNILRDLKEDCALGRVYLPAEDLKRFGYSRQDLEAGLNDRAFREMMQFEADRARAYYRSSERLESCLSNDAKPVFRTMLRIYRGLLDEMERRRFDVFSERVRLSPWTKSRIVVSELVKSRWRR